jgi:hypothetical protein
MDEEIIMHLNAIFSDYYETRKQGWFYGVRLPDSSKHSLCSALGLQEDECFVLLDILGLRVKHGKGYRTIKDASKWRGNSVIGKYFVDENSISLSTTLGSAGSSIFLRLGKPDALNATLVVNQSLEARPPYLTDKMLQKKRSKLKEAITRYQRCQSSPTAAATANSESSQVPSQQPPSNSIETANSESPPRGRSERLPEISPEKDLLQKYRDMNYGMDAEELIVADKTKYPMLSMFKIPLAPILLQKLSCELVNLQKEHSTCNINNIVEANQTGGNHSYCNVTLLRPSNERSFGKHCFEKLRDLPRALVKDFVTKGMDDNEREEAARKETQKIRTWCINALLDDDDTGESVIAVARKRFNMIEKVKMPAGDIGAMIGLANITPTSFLAIKSFMQTFYGYQMFESKTALRDLYNDSIVPLVDQYIEIDSEIKIDYSYKSIVDTLRQFNTLVNAAIGNERTLKEHKLTIVTEVKTARKAFNAAKKKLKDSLGSRKYNEKPVRVKLYEIFKKYGIRPEQYHGGEFVGNHCRILMSKGRMIMQEIAAMLKLLPVNRRRKRGGSANVVSDEEIDEKLNTLSDLLILADLIYSTCHQPAGSLTDADVQKSQEIIQTFSDMWRNCDMVSLTRKAHNIEKHLFTYLRRFRGLKEYDESFIERDHQRGAQYHLRSSNVKKYDDLAKIHSSWERLTRNPRVASARKNYDNSRRKRRTSEGVILRQSEEKRIKTEGREEVFARCRRGG